MNAKVELESHSEDYHEKFLIIKIWEYYLRLLHRELIPATPQTPDSGGGGGIG